MASTNETVDRFVRIARVHGVYAYSGITRVPSSNRLRPGSIIESVAIVDGSRCFVRNVTSLYRGSCKVPTCAIHLQIARLRALESVERARFCILQEINAYPARIIMIPVIHLAECIRLHEESTNGSVYGHQLRFPAGEIPSGFRTVGLPIGQFVVEG